MNPSPRLKKPIRSASIVSNTKRFRTVLFFSGLAMIMTVSCIFNIAGLGGSNSGKLVADPAAGLESLTHYRADLTISIHGKAADGPADRTEDYSLSVWPSQQAV